MTRILSVECYGDLTTGWVPCISWPLPELGDGKVEDAPMLVPIGPQQWELRVAVRGVAADSCLTACVPGMRPLQFPISTSAVAISHCPRVSDGRIR